MGKEPPVSATRDHLLICSKLHARDGREDFGATLAFYSIERLSRLPFFARPIPKEGIKVRRACRRRNRCIDVVLEGLSG